MFSFGRIQHTTCDCGDLADLFPDGIGLLFAQIRRGDQIVLAAATELGRMVRAATMRGA